MSDGSGIESKQFLEKLQELFAEVELAAQARHEKGAHEYGPFTFLENDTIEMAIEEVLDLMNYCRYTAVKLLLLQEFIAQKAAPLEQSDTTGGFIPTSKLVGLDKEDDQ